MPTFPCSGTGTRRSTTCGLLAAASASCLVFVVGAGVLRPEARLGPEVLVLRGLGALAFSLLHLILIIGPLARLTTRAAPLLYNRRHLGVATFLVGLLHGFLSLGYYGGFGVVGPLRAFFGDGADGPLLRPSL